MLTIGAPVRDLPSGLAPALVVGSGSLTVLFSIGPSAQFAAILLFAWAALIQIPDLFSGRVHVPWESLLFALLICLLFAWLGASIAWTKDPLSVSTHMALTAAQPVMAIVVLYVMRNRSADWFVDALLFIGLVVTVALMAMLAYLGPAAYDATLRLSYLTIGMSISLALLVSVGRFVLQPGFRYGLYVLVLATGLAISLGRGPLLLAIASVVVGLPFAVLVIHGISRGLVKLCVHLASLGVGILFVVNIALSMQRSRAKLLRLLDPQQELATGGRGQLWENAIQAISSAPIKGHGIGSSGLLTAGAIDAYPHNILLEAWIDGGILAFVLLLAILLLPLLIVGLNWPVLRSSRLGLPLFLGLIYLSLEYMKSETLYAVHILFIWSAMTVFHFAMVRRPAMSHKGISH